MTLLLLLLQLALVQRAGHGMSGSAEHVSTWESSRLRRLLQSSGLLNHRARTQAYGILVNRRRHV